MIETHYNKDIFLPGIAENAEILFEEAYLQDKKCSKGARDAVLIVGKVLMNLCFHHLSQES
jgi:hypothetical protein